VKAVAALAALSIAVAAGAVVTAQSGLGQAPPVADPLAQRLGAQLVKERAVHRLERPRLYAAGYARAKREFVLDPDVRSMIRTVAVAFGISPQQHLARAVCESRLNATVVNPTSGVGGLFQFEQTTWTGFTRVGAAGLSRFDPLANALGAAEMISAGQQSHWDCSYNGVPKSRGGPRE